MNDLTTNMLVNMEIMCNRNESTPNIFVNGLKGMEMSVKRINQVQNVCE